MTSRVSVVPIEITVPIVATEQTFLQLAVRAAGKKFRTMQAGASDCAEPACTEPVAMCRAAA